MATPSFTTTSGTVRKWKDPVAHTGAVVSIGKQVLNTPQEADTRKLIADLERTLPAPPPPPPSGVTLAPAPACPAPPQGWTVAFGDTFSTGQLDTDYWVPNRSAMAVANQDHPGDNGNNNELFNSSQLACDTDGLEITCLYRPEGSYPYLSGYLKTESSLVTPGMSPQGFQLQMDEQTMWAFEMVCTLPPTTVAGQGADWNFWLTDNPAWTIEIDLFEIWDWNPSFYSFTPATWIYDTRGGGMEQTAFYSNSGLPMPAFVTDGKEHKLTWQFTPEERHVQPFQDGVAMGPGISYPASFNTQGWMMMIIEAATRVENTVTATRKMNVRSVAAYYRTGDPAKVKGGGLAAGTIVA